VVATPGRLSFRFFRSYFNRNGGILAEDADELGDLIGRLSPPVLSWLANFRDYALPLAPAQPPKTWELAFSSRFLA